MSHKKLRRPITAAPKSNGDALIIGVGRILNWLIILVIVGTLDQREFGLYAAQQKYFSSWFTWLSFIPIPSGRLIMTNMVINLSCYFFRPNIFKKN